MLIFGLTSSRFDPQWGYFAAGASMGLVLSGAAGVMSQWLSDRLDGDYGRLLRELDPDEAAAQAPFWIIIGVGIIATAWCILAAILIGGIGSKVLRAVLAAGATGLVVWSVLGLFSLAILRSRHQRNIARLRSLRERIERLPSS